MKREEDCLVINYDAFDKYYHVLSELVAKENSIDAADILLTMNG